VARIFFDALHSLMHRTAPRDLELMNESGLTIPQIVALHVLSQRGACTVGDLADCTRLSPAATSHLVERLVRLGLANRAEDVEDRRQKRVTVSPDGAAILGRLEQKRLETIGEAVGHLSPATRGKLAEAMQAVLAEASAKAPAKEARR